MDRELIGYADRAIGVRFNSLLREVVPRVEKAERSVGEMLPVTDDPLLMAVRERRYVVKFDGVDVPFEDLCYWTSGDGYSLSVTENRNSTVMSKEEGGHYLVKCPKCDDQPVKLIRQGEELRAIACSRCKARLVRVDPKAARSPAPRRARAPDPARPRR